MPVIGIGGVATIDDVSTSWPRRRRGGRGRRGARGPDAPVRLADELADACRARGLDIGASLVGTAVPAEPGPASTRGAEYAR